MCSRWTVSRVTSVGPVEMFAQDRLFKEGGGAGLGVDSEASGASMGNVGVPTAAATMAGGARLEAPLVALNSTDFLSSAPRNTFFSLPWTHC